MNKTNYKLLQIAKNIALDVGLKIQQEDNQNQIYTFDDKNIKEIKAEIDTFAERLIIQELTLTGLSILSEEKGWIAGDSLDPRRWIIDPIDGTFNFIKKLGPCAISIGLWEKDTPIFGVIFCLNSGELFWGGKHFGAFCGDVEISVSRISELTIASVCTGFPVRLNVNEINSESQFWKLIKGFSKIRMIGCASISLTYVARGSTDAYFENQIMIWDVAAGLALVEGAGGRVSIKMGLSENSLEVMASNQVLFKPIQSV
jgi:myo-inositol-1(or 4)-monophosphatase